MTTLDNITLALDDVYAFNLKEDGMRAATLLTTARKEAGLTQRDLAAWSGVPQTTIARIEVGNTDPRVGTMSRLLAACGRDVSLADARSPQLSERARAYLPEITRRITEIFRPERIVLFGSQARGSARPDSDLDLLVILPTVENKRERRVAIRVALADIPIDKDIVVVSSEEARRRSRVPGSIVGAALREGVVLHGA